MGFCFYLQAATHCCLHLGQGSKTQHPDPGQMCKVIEPRCEGQVATVSGWQQQLSCRNVATTTTTTTKLLIHCERSAEMDDDLVLNILTKTTSSSWI
jgi:hypothetical protein